MGTDFLSVALKYYEKGIQTIPISNKAIRDKDGKIKSQGKASFIEKWSLFGQNKKTLDEIKNAFYSRSDTSGIGIPFGEACPICAVDIDDCSDEVKAVVPPSPVARQGKTGREVRFYRKDPTCKCTKEAIAGVEIFYLSGQVLIPPSFHFGEKRSYQWITKETLLSIDLNDLPILTNEQCENILTVASNNIEHTTIEKRISGKTIIAEGGRNNKMVEAITAKIMDQQEQGRMDLHEITREIIDFDKEYFDPSLLEEEAHSKKTTVEDEATRFVMSVFESLRKKGLVKLGKQKQIKVEISDIEKIKVESIETKLKPYPIPEIGFIRDFVEVCAENSITRNDALALSGAYAALGALASLRFVGEIGKKFTITPNIYCVSVAATGSGKETPQSIIRKLLGDSDLLGFDSYKSDKAFITKLKEQRARIDVMDEFQNFLNTLNGKAFFQTGIGDVMSTIWGKANGEYRPPFAASDRELLPVYFQPCISILGSTTPRGLTDSVNKSNVEKGLLPRCIIFYQPRAKELSESEYKKQLLRSLSTEYDEARWHRLNDFVQTFLKIERTEGTPHKNVLLRNHPKFLPRKLMLTADALDCFSTHSSKIDQQVYNEDTEYWKKCFLTRAAHNASKIALLYALSTVEGLYHTKVLEAHHIQFGFDSIHAIMHNASTVMEEASCENLNDKILTKMLTYVREMGIVSKSSMYKRFRAYYKQVPELITYMEKMDLVDLVKIKAENVDKPTIYVKNKTAKSEEK